MSSRVFQSIVIQMKEASGRTVGVIDSAGLIVASSELSLVGSTLGASPLIEDAAGRTVRSFGYTFRALGGQQHFDYAVFVNGEDDFAQTVCLMADIALTEAKAYYEEKHDNAAFVKSIISNNILPGDLYVRAKGLHLATDVTRAVFLVRQVKNPDVTAIESLQNLFPDRQKDFVISVSETDIVVIKEVPLGTDGKELYKLAASIEQKLSDETDVSTVIGIGTPAKHLRELADRYKEAQVAIDVGKVFDTDKTIINYENLGIGRLIYQLPTTLCEMFLAEVFKKNPIDSLDEETLYTIKKFFENNLNVSETSRKLFVHRNTLVYRLEKIKKLTGLDLREFDHAIVFKVALMVKKYLSSQENAG